MQPFGLVHWKTSMLACGVVVVVMVSACSSEAETPEVAPRTPAAVFEAQSQLYSALFEDPPDINSAVAFMSSSCQETSSDSEEAVEVVLTEVELAQSAGISEESVLSIFSEISYTIEGDVASGNDGSEWVYEDGGWRSTDC